MNADSNLVDLECVVKQYPGEPEPLTVLRDVDFRLAPGERVAVVGPSGSGKSTLLNLLGALDTPTSGRVLFKGRDLAGISANELAAIRNREIGFVFQLHHLLPQCTVFENILIPALIAGNVPAARDRAAALLDRVGLAARRDCRPGQLSGGERQRAAVVRALVNRPSLLLADEPTGSLNEEAAVQLADLILELNREQEMAVVLVTHSLPIAERIGPIVELHRGRLKPFGHEERAAAPS